MEGISSTLWVYERLVGVLLSVSIYLCLWQPVVDCEELVSMCTHCSILTCITLYTAGCYDMWDTGLGLCNIYKALDYTCRGCVVMNIIM